MIEENEPPPTVRRNWGEIRDWMNVAVAAAAFFLSIISFWTTAQISGLEDYLRSEIAMRNDEIVSRREKIVQIDEDYRAAEKRLSELSVVSNKLTLQALTSQSEIQLANAQILVTRREEELAQRALLQAQSEIRKNRDIIADQSKKLALIDRQSLYAALSARILFRNEFGESGQLSGSSAISLLQRVGLDFGDGGENRFYRSVRESGPRICSFLQGYAPDLEQELEYPKRPEMPGERFMRDGVEFSRMSRAEESEWRKEEQEFFSSLKEVSEENSRRRERIRAVESYLTDSLLHCSCLAMADQDIPASQICGDRSSRKPKLPEGVEEE